MTPRLGLALLPPLAALALAAPAAAQVNGVTDAEILFGMSAPFSGTEKEFGRQLRIGWELAFAAQNEAGGVNGRKLKLLPMDDGYEPARTKTAMKELLEGRKVFAVVGNFGSATAAVSVPYANEKGVLLYAAYSGASLLRNDPPDRFVFNLRASYAEETAAIVGYLVEVRRIPAWQIAVFAQEDAFGDAGFDGVAKVMRHYRRDPAKVLRVGYKRNTADVEEAVQGILRHARGLKAVVMVATYKPAARFVEKLKDAGHGRLVFSNVSFVGSNELAEELTQLGPGYADGVVVTQVVPNPLAKASATLRYQKELKAHAPGEKPDFLSLEGWVAARLLIEGLQRAGKTLNTEAVVEALEGIKALDLGLGVPLTFAPSEHQASHKVWGTVMDGKGEFRSLELE
jgi:branched-chain amino acid transport system substrate-binding protein